MYLNYNKVNQMTIGLVLFLSIYIYSYLFDDFILLPFVLVMVLSCFIIACRKNLPLVLFGFFIFLFPFDFLLAYFSGEKLLPVYKLEYINDVFLFLGVALSILSPFISTNGVGLIGTDLAFIRSNKVLVLYLMIAALLTISIRGESVLFVDGSYQQYQDNLSKGSGVIEYTLMLFIASIFFKKNRILKIISIICVLFYIFKMILLGFRVQSMVALLVLCFMVLNKNPKPITNLILCLVAFFSMLSYGILKEGINIFEDGLSFNILLDTRYGYVQSHQHGVLSSSTVMLSYPSSDDIPELLNWPAAALASTIPRFVLDSTIPFVYPSAYIQKFEYTPGGGLFPVQIMYLLGLPGLIIISFLLGRIFLGYINAKKTDVYVVSGVTLLCFFPRWVSYDFFNFGFRTLFMVLILVYGPIIISRFLDSND